MKTRYIVQCADTGPFDSLAHMLLSIGLRVCVPSAELRERLATCGGLVLSNEYLQKTMGYEPLSRHEVASDINPGDVLLDVKAHQTYERLVETWPHLKGRVGWYRINGGEPEHVPGKGDELNPPCPVVTPNQWYQVHPKAYTFWPTLMDRHRYSRITAESPADFSSPVCLIHNVEGWGYGTLVDDCVRMGVRVFGRGSPNGLVQHATVPHLLRSALCMVHLKTSDAPGYALLEAAAAGCPLVVSRRLIRRCRMEALFEPLANCFAFDKYGQDGLWDVCAREIASFLEVLKDPHVNRSYGEALRDRYLKLEWSVEQDSARFASFLVRVGLGPEGVK